MAFKQTIWNKSNVTAKYPSVEPGIRNLKITSASYMDESDPKYNPENPTYKLVCEDVESGARFWLFYWPDGDSKSARAACGTLISLGKALAGVEIGLPFPDDIIGGVVTAEVMLNEKGYPRVYKFTAAPEDVVAEHSDLDDQYYEGSEDTELVH